MKIIDVNQLIAKHCMQNTGEIAVSDTEEFEITVELRLGSALSPFRDTERGPMGYAACRRVVVCTEKKEEVEQRLEMWRGALEVRWG